MTAGRFHALGRPAALAVAIAATAFAGWRLLRENSTPPVPPPPIPLPANLPALDPQVRDHLARLAQEVARSPLDPEPRADLGLALAVNDLWAEARPCFLDALALRATHPLPALYAGVALQELGDLPGATSELKSVVERFPDFPPARHRLGTILLLVGDVDGAFQAFSALTRLAPEEWRGWAGLGEALLRLGQPTAAIDALERAIAIDPFARSARHLLAQAYRTAGRTADADRESAAGRGQTTGPMPDPWSERAIGHMRLLPDQFEHADALVAHGRGAEAVALLERALAFHPTNTALLARLAGALNAVGQPEEAWNRLHTALSGFPDPPPVGLMVAAAHTTAALGRPQDAQDWARKAILAAPAWVDARVAMADALLAAGRDEDAAAELRRALESAPRNVTLLIQRGDILWHNLHRLDDAAAAYAQAVDADPIHPVALERLAELQIERRDWREAEKWLAQLRRLSPAASPPHPLEHRLREAQSSP